MQSPLCFNVSLILLHALLVQFSDATHVVIIRFFLALRLIILQPLHKRPPLLITHLALLIAPLLFHMNGSITLFFVDACLHGPFCLSLFKFSCHRPEVRLNLCIFRLRCFLCVLCISPVHEQQLVQLHPQLLILLNHAVHLCSSDWRFPGDRLCHHGQLIFIYFFKTKCSILIA